MFGDRKTEKESLRDRRIKRKEILICLLGGKCIRCGIVGESCIYDFHHKEEKKKGFTVASKLCTGTEDFESIVIPEIREKCILLCSNCHRIIHSDEDERILVGG